MTTINTDELAQKVSIVKMVAETASIAHAGVVPEKLADAIDRQLLGLLKFVDVQ